MVDGIRSGGAGRAAIEAALKRMQSRAEELGGEARANGAQGGDGFAALVRDGVRSVDAAVERTEGLHLDAVAGRLDLHEVAAQLKESEMTFEFALQVRNKLLDAYREVMRMSV